MNLFKLHTHPEELYGYEQRWKKPGAVYDEWL